MNIENKNIIMLMNNITRMFQTIMKSKSGDDCKMVTYRPILFALEHNDGCNQMDIVVSTMYKASTISLTIKNMEQDGLIRREEDKLDKRNVRIFLTEKGRESNVRIHEIASEVRTLFLNNLSNEEIDSVKDIIIKIYRNAEEAL